jgi:hypothetical protein
MFKESLVAKSGQTWKLGLGLSGILAGSGIMFVGLSRLRVGGTPYALTGMALGVVAGIAACVSIRCSKCGMRWLWAAVRNQDQLQWLNWLLAQRVCPRCGDRGSSRNE